MSRRSGGRSRIHSLTPAGDKKDWSLPRCPSCGEPEKPSGLTLASKSCRSCFGDALVRAVMQTVGFNPQYADTSDIPYWECLV
jgi:hypothetical protein